MEIGRVYHLSRILIHFLQTSGRRTKVPQWDVMTYGNESWGHPPTEQQTRRSGDTSMSGTKQSPAQGYWWELQTWQTPRPLHQLWWYDLVIIPGHGLRRLLWLAHYNLILNMRSSNTSYPSHNHNCWSIWKVSAGPYLVRAEMAAVLGWCEILSC